MSADLAAFAVWSPDPVMLRLGGIELRWYGLCFLAVFVLGYLAWHRQMLRGGHAFAPVSRVLAWAAVGVVAGGRLAHCLLYEPDVYLRDPLAILDLSRGGLASHGSTAGVVLALFLYARRHRYAFVEVLDRFAFSAMLGAALVRVGNFMNSEVVGREWWGPWALRFERFATRSQAAWEGDHGPLGWTAQPLPRHPSQLYEVAGALAVLTVLVAVDRRLGESRPRGLLAGLCVVLYFGFRFGVEFAKEFQRLGTLAPDAGLQVIRVVPEAGLTLGQWLSIPFALAGAALVVWALRIRAPAAAPSRSDAG